MDAVAAVWPRVGLALFSMLRRWLPDQSLTAGLVGVAIGAGLAVRPVGLLTTANSDFRLVAPVPLAVALCLAMLALFGATFGVLVDNLAPRWPRPGWSLRGVASVLPFGLLLPAPPIFIATLIAVLGSTVAARPRTTDEDHTMHADARRPGARPGRILVLAAGGAGSLSILIAASQVLAPLDRRVPVSPDMCSEVPVAYCLRSQGIIESAVLIGVDLIGRCDVEAAVECC